MTKDDYFTELFRQFLQNKIAPSHWGWQIPIPNVPFPTILYVVLFENVIWKEHLPLTCQHKNGSEVAMIFSAFISMGSYELLSHERFCGKPFNFMIMDFWKLSNNIGCTVVQHRLALFLLLLFWRTTF